MIVVSKKGNELINAFEREAVASTRQSRKKSWEPEEKLRMYIINLEYDRKGLRKERALSYYRLCMILGDEYNGSYKKEFDEDHSRL